MRLQILDTLHNGGLTMEYLDATMRIFGYITGV